LSTNFSNADIQRGKELVVNISKNQYALGELADRIEKSYGNHTLEDFAKAIGISYDTLKGHRYVWRRWKDSPVKPRNFSVARALASYKDRDEFIRQWPDAIEEEAREYVKHSKKEAKKKKDEEMLDAEKKGVKLPNLDRFAENFIADINKKFKEKWEYQLDQLSSRRNRITIDTIVKVVDTLNRYANILLDYKDKFKTIRED
jgi:hypothetical protein